MPGPARQGLNALLAAMPEHDVWLVDFQLRHPIMVYDVDEHGQRAERPYRVWEQSAGPWLTVKFSDGGEFAIWKYTGDVYRVGPDGAVGEDPFIERTDL